MYYTRSAGDLAWPWRADCVCDHLDARLSIAHPSQGISMLCLRAAPSLPAAAISMYLTRSSAAPWVTACGRRVRGSERQRAVRSDSNALAILQVSSTLLFLVRRRCELAQPAHGTNHRNLGQHEPPHGEPADCKQSGHEEESGHLRRDRHGALACCEHAGREEELFTPAPYRVISQQPLAKLTSARP